MPLSLSLYRGLTRLVPLAAPLILRRRLARGKEDPARWRERLGHADAARLEGPLVWLNAVGLGEVMALRALIPLLAEELPDAHFLVTTTSRTSAWAFGGQMPPRTIHQFMPLDAPLYLARFFDHWQPDLCIWTDQDLWPGAISTAQNRAIPQAWVNGRMNAASRKRWARAGGLLPALLRPMPVVSVQETSLAMALRAIGVAQASARPSLKAAAPPLACDAEDLERLKAALAGRTAWVAGPSYAEDEAAALSAHRALMAAGPAPMLILCPRDPARGAEVAAAARAAGFQVAQRSAGQGPQGAEVYVADTIGEMGLWYQLAEQALIGGSFGDTEGHSPWEALALGCAVLHGGRTANFAEDYQRLDARGVACEVAPMEIAEVIAKGADGRGARGQALCEAARGDLRPLARDLAALVRP